MSIRSPLPSRARSILAALALASASLSAQTVKLSGPLARPIGGDIVGFQLDPLGKRAVYLADEDTDDVFELYSVRPGSKPVRLNPPLAQGDRVREFQLAPDGSRVVYKTDRSGTFELFSVSSRGGPVVPLNLPLSADAHVRTGFRIDPGSRYVVFSAATTDNRSLFLFSAPIDGSGPAVQLSHGGTPVNFVIGGDHVVFRVSQAGSAPALFSARLDGTGETVTLVPEGGNRLGFAITPDGSRVLYVDGNLFSIPIEGHAPAVRLSLGPQSDDVRAFRITPDSRRVAYTRGGVFSTSTLGDESPVLLAPDVEDIELEGESGTVLFTRLESFAPVLWSVPITGGAPVRISGADPVRAFRVAPGKRVVYVSDLDDPSGFPNLLELRIAPVNGLAPSMSLASFDVNEPFADFSVLADDVVYRAWTDAPSTELFGVPLDGSRPPRRLSDALLAERDVRPGYAASADGKRVAFLADQENDEVFELYLAPSDGRLPAYKLNPALPIGPVRGEVTAARYDGDGTHAVFVADAQEDDVFELFSVGTAGGKTPLRLNETLVPGGDVLDFRLASQRVVYRADQDENEVPRLYSVPIDGGAVVRIDAGGPGVLDFRLTGDGTKAVYLTDEDGDFRRELHVAPVEGSAPSLQLASGLPPSSDVFAISPLSDRAVFRSSQPNELPDLFSVSLAGGPPVPLNDPLSPFDLLGGSAITPDGARVVYTAEAVTGDALFSVPIDGSAAPLQLSAGLPGPFSITALVPSPDGSRVVFAADAVTQGTYELFVVPVDGSAAPVPLRTSSAEQPTFSPDGTRVVFLVPIMSTVKELWSVPVDASAVPTMLAPALFYELGFRPEVRFRIAPDGQNVVLRAATQPGGNYRLFGVPMDGSRAPALLSKTSESFVTVRSDYRFTPDGGTLVYRIGSGSRETDGSDFLHVPVDGSRPPVRITRIPEVAGFDLSPDGEHVLHRSELDNVGIVELYGSRLRAGPRATRR